MHSSNQLKASVMEHKEREQKTNQGGRKTGKANKKGEEREEM